MTENTYSSSAPLNFNKNKKDNKKAKLLFTWENNFVDRCPRSYCEHMYGNLGDVTFKNISVQLTILRAIKINKQ